MKKKIVFLVLMLTYTLTISACSRTSSPKYAEIPAGKAYANGETIYFSHTEISDPGVGELLTKMMNSPVLVVPSLASIPDSALAKVYVFTNGVAGSGPLKFQPDVFPNPPGDEGYSPLRKVIFATWADESKARELMSENDILALVESGELSLEESDIVVNMPFMTWVGGQR